MNWFAVDKFESTESKNVAEALEKNLRRDRRLAATWKLHTCYVSVRIAITCWFAQPLQDLQTHADGNHPSPAVRINWMLQRLSHCKEFNVSVLHSAHQGTSEHLNILSATI